MSAVGNAAGSAHGRSQPAAAERPSAPPGPGGDGHESDDAPFSLLFAAPTPAVAAGAPPAYFSDLRLDHLLASPATESPEPGLLSGVLCRRLDDPEQVRYRQDVFRDLQDDPQLRAAAGAFVESMTAVRRHRERLEKMADVRQRQAWLLDAAAVYCRAVTALADQLARAEPHSRALQTARGHLARYRDSDGFRALCEEAFGTQEALGLIRYCLRLRGGRVEVSRYTGQEDYSVQVLETFQRFQQGAVKDYLARYRTGPDLGHVQSNVLALLARLYPEEFGRLDRFCVEHASFESDQLCRLDAELRFFLGYLRLIAPACQAGLPFCYPQLDSRASQLSAEDTFDLPLALKLVADGTPVVLNSFALRDPERIVVVSGPNQGGKTTFARMFGQLHHLAAVGCPVPGRAANLLLADHIFAHFEREEDLSSLRGKLEDDLVRIHEVLARASDRSVVVLNEIFTSTTLDDARYLGTEVVNQMIALGVRGVYVTFVDELASLGPAVVSMVSTIVPERPAERTYRIVRAPADGLAYALAIAQKYRLTYEQLLSRLTR